MTKEEYFGDWLLVLPKQEMEEAINKIKHIKDKICPHYNNIFKAFHKCPYNKLRLVILGQDPYPQPNKATGLAFANYNDTPENLLSESLQVIKESVINYEIPHNLLIFASELEEWAAQGVLLINTALTCEVNKPESHSLIWRPFITKLLCNICEHNPGTVFLLLGNRAQSYEPYLKNQYIIKARHPAYYAINNIKFPYHIWHQINQILKGIYGYGINFYKEELYEDNLCN